MRLARGRRRWRTEGWGQGRSTIVGGMPTSSEMSFSGDGWSTSKHETLFIDLSVATGEAHTYLRAFLEADGQAYMEPYEAVRVGIQKALEAGGRSRGGQQPRVDVRPQRIRSWKTFFESLGLLTVDDESGTLHVSPLGTTVRQMYGALDRRAEGANDHLAAVATRVLCRILLRNPLEGGEYPDDSDLHPFRAIFRTMRQLDDRLHWEELNRVLMHLYYEHEVAAAIERIADVRAEVGGKYDADSLAALGEPLASDPRRITPWFSRASFGGLLMSADADGDGYRHLNPHFLALIDAAIQDEVELPIRALTNPDAYMRYLTHVPTLGVTKSAADSREVENAITAIERYGGRKIIAFSGLPGTGKSHLARLVATAAADADPYRFAEVQFHETTTYESFVEGFVPRTNGEGFELVPKVLRTINRRARLDPMGVRYVLLIEELTRANVHAVLGELLTYIEHRERSFTWAVSQEEDQIADNLVILATFNPRDRSALTLDHAIVRRLHQIRMSSSVDRLHEMLEDRLPAESLGRLESWFAEHVDVLPFGHAEFSDVQNEQDLRDLWRGTLLSFFLDPAGAVRAPYERAVDSYPWKD